MPAQMIDRWYRTQSSGASCQTNKTTPTQAIITRPARRQHKQYQACNGQPFDIDSDEFKIAVNVPRWYGSHARQRDASWQIMTVGAGVDPHDAARAAFRQAQQNRIDR